MLNYTTLLSDLRSTVNALSCRPTAERKDHALQLLMELASSISAIDVPEGNKVTKAKPQAAKAAKRQVKPVKTTKPSPTEKIADKQEIAAATPKGFAVTKADKAVAADRVAKQQAEAAERSAKRETAVASPKVNAKSNEAMLRMQTALQALTELASANAEATNEVRNDITSLEARVAALEAKPKAKPAAKRSAKAEAFADMLLDSDFDGMPF
jgi:hypothetical protein